MRFFSIFNSAILAALILVGPQIQGAMSCKGIHRQALPTEEKLRILNEAIAPLKGDQIAYILTFKLKPTWTDYNSMNQLLNLLRKPELRLYEKSERDQLAKNLSETQTRVFRNLAELEKLPLSKEIVNRFVDFNWAFFKLAKEINEELRIELFPLPDLNQLRSEKKMIQQAEALIAGIQPKIEETFSTTGYKSYEDYLAFVNQHSDLSRRLVEITTDHLEIAIHRPESARFWIPIAGFQNQRITGTSKGSYYGDTSSANARDKAEANFSGQEIEDHFLHSPRFKPNYGEARPSVEVSDLKPGVGASWYGNDIWIMKKEKVSQRTTWTAADSLGPGVSLGKADGIDKFALPWSYRTMIVPYALASAKTDGLFQPSAPLATEIPLNRKPWEYAHGYFELQIWGPLGIDDVRAFIFKSQPPSREFFEYLQSKDIEVWDERQSPAKLYVPNSLD